MTTKTTERDLITEVEELLAKARVHALYERETIKNRDVTELLRRLVEENKQLREQWSTRINTLCGNCGQRYLGPRDEHLHGLGICGGSRNG